MVEYWNHDDMFFWSLVWTVFKDIIEMPCTVTFEYLKVELRMIQSCPNKKWVQLQWCHIQCVPKKIESRHNDGPHANPQFRVLLTAPFAEKPCRFTRRAWPSTPSLRNWLKVVPSSTRLCANVWTSVLGANTARRATSTAKDVAFF